MLRKKYNPNKSRSEWALVSVKKPGKVLKWFGLKKPSQQRVQAEERRVKFFEHRR